MMAIWADVKDALAITLFAVIAMVIILIMGFYSVLHAVGHLCRAKITKIDFAGIKS